MNQSLPGPLVGPYKVIDADSREPIRKNRIGRLAVAFDRLDGYLLERPGADALVLDDAGRPVPRPHSPLPTPVLDGQTVTERRRAFRRNVWLRRLERLDRLTA